MTEAEWQGAVSFELYLRACQWLAESPTNHRKLRLWACACCDRLGDLLSDPRSQDAVRAAERLADRLATTREVKAAKTSALQVPQVKGMLTRRKYPGPAPMAASAATFVLHDNPAEFSQTAPIRARSALELAGRATRNAEELAQFLLLRDTFGNPFRPVTFSFSWRTSTTLALATQMYESRDFSAMPILADALQDAGCDSADVLDHCRGAGPHVRGCWVVDQVLGKE